MPAYTTKDAKVNTAVSQLIKQIKIIWPVIHKKAANKMVARIDTRPVATGRSWVRNINRSMIIRQVINRRSLAHNAICVTKEKDAER